MANYYANARSNYFAVKDVEAFKAAMPSEIGVWTDNQGLARVAIFAEGADGNGWQSHEYADDLSDEGVEIDLPALIAPHLLDGEVAILMEVGNEKLRYLIGHAVAVNSKGKTTEIDLSMIYELAEKQLGAARPVNRAES